MLNKTIDEFIDLLRHDNSPLASRCLEYYETLVDWHAADKEQRLLRVVNSLNQYIYASRDTAMRLKVCMLLACTCAALGDEPALNNSIRLFCQIYEQFDK